MDHSTEFAQTFRKANSCDYCRKQKQKCAYTSPDATSCIKCVENNVECHVTPRQKRTVRKKRTVDGKLAWLESKPVKNQYDRELKAEQLKEVIQEAQAELGRLQPGVPFDSTSGNYGGGGYEKLSSAESSNSPHSADSGGSQDYLQRASRQGLVYLHEIPAVLQKFQAHMSYFLPFSLELSEDIFEYDSPQSILALTVLLAYKVSTTPDHNTKLQGFIDAAVIDMIYTNPLPSLYIVKALVILNGYVRPTDESKVPTYILLGHSAAVQLDLGGSEDIHGLKSYDLGRKQHHLERCRVYLSLSSAIHAIAMNTSKMAILDVLPDHTRLHASVLSAGTKDDHIMVRMQQSLLQYRRTIDVINSPDKQNLPFYEEIEPVLKSNQNKQAELTSIIDKLCATSAPDSKYARGFTPFGEKSRVAMLNIHETSLNQVIFNQNGANPEVVRMLAASIIQLAQILVKEFVDTALNTTEGLFLPKVFYLPPLHGACALIRLRLLLWTQGIFDFEVPVEAMFAHLRSFWGDSMTSSTLSMKGELDKVERWAALRMDDWTVCCNFAIRANGLSPTAQMLQLILKDGGVTCPNKPPEDQPRVEYGGYKVSDLFSMTLEDQNALARQIPDLAVSEPAGVEPSPGSTTSSVPSNENNEFTPNPYGLAAIDRGDPDRDIEKTLKEIFSELGASVYVD